MSRMRRGSAGDARGRKRFLGHLPQPAQVHDLQRCEAHLDHVHAVRSAARELRRSAPAALEVLVRDAHGGAEARARAPGLHLDHDQDRAVAHDEVELAEARAQSPCEQHEAVTAEVMLGQALASATVARVAWIEPAERAPRSPATEQRQERRARRAQALLGTFSSTGAAAGSVTTLWIAARAKRRRTLSATCSTTTSFVDCTTVP